MAWEYKQVKVNSHGTFSPYIDDGQDVLDQHAKEGWELVTVVPMVYLAHTDRVYYVFKRQM